jgi:hypothetical protein
MNSAIAYLPKPPPQLRTGNIVGWVVICPQTGEWVMRCESRFEARDIAHASGARFAKVEISK